MRLDQIIHGIALKDRRGRLDCEIAGITFDSRRAQPGALFVAVRGSKSDGHRYIEDAVRRGAAAVMAEEWAEDLDAKVSARPQAVLVSNTRRALALAAANFYGQPSRRLLVAGVTGTNGKTTVTYLLESIVRAASRSVGVLGTIEARYAGRNFPIDHTTPDPVVLQRHLAEMVAAGVTHVVMEVSSHALDQQRVAGVHFKVAGFTNLTQDHLDYHQDLDRYFQAKKLLFSDVLRKSRARGRMAVVNVDDPRGEELIQAWGGKSLRISLEPRSDADVVALASEFRLNGTRATVRTPKGVWELETSLVGPHNLSNTLLAVGMALAMGFSRARIERGLRALERVPGRLDPVPSEEGKRVFVDYAHTPDALRRMLGALRPLTKGRLVVVFGCGGDRDRAKRSAMGQAVAELADQAIVTNDNPRSEEPAAIAAEVEEGLRRGGWSRLPDGAGQAKGYRVELDRRAAIRSAINVIGPEDVLIIAGKGHESYQIVGNEKRYFDDRDEARRILAGLPPPPPQVISFSDNTGEIEESQVVESVELVGTTEILAEDIEGVVRDHSRGGRVELKTEPTVDDDLEEQEPEVLEDEEPEVLDASEVIEDTSAPPENTSGAGSGGVPGTGGANAPPGEPKT
ncbi:MAG: UDP-N-acetylmuramoyl-L-alanyl-D-glutamate--2,6-diaminopimelate ligase [Deltaproteobacteria bacterium]|nr:UDP-N-acetylmuramoyl-L-alanyl-D-glutamate--2,6-diaminopimelate ligase [Deltaproteobacteria bacterium]